MLDNQQASRALAGNRLQMLRHYWLEIAIVTATIVVQSHLILTSDLSWLLTVGERILAGGKLGIDVIELNPPLSWIVYLPGAWIGQRTPLPADLAVLTMTVLFALLQVKLTLSLAGPWHHDGASRRRARIVLLAATLLLPAMHFGQREHLAVLGLLPFVALVASPVPSTRTLRVLCGLGAGFAMCLKPHLAAVAGLPLLWALARRPSWRNVFRIEALVAAAVVFAYVGMIVLFFPQILTADARLASQVYVTNREDLRTLLAYGFGATSIASILLVVLVIGPKSPDWRQAGPWCMAALGGAISYLVQGKGFGYTLLPMVTLSLCIAWLSPTMLRETTPFSGRFAKARFAAVIVLTLELWVAMVEFRQDHGRFVPLITAHAPPHPALLAITPHISIGEPLVRLVHGTWASAAGSQLTSGAVARLERESKVSPEDRPGYARLVFAERARLRSDLVTRRPDVVMIDTYNFRQKFDWEGWARTDGEIDRVLRSDYAFFGEHEGIRFYFRRKPGAAE